MSQIDIDCVFYAPLLDGAIGFDIDNVPDSGGMSTTHW